MSAKWRSAVRRTSSPPWRIRSNCARGGIRRHTASGARRNREPREVDEACQRAAGPRWVREPEGAQLGDFVGDERPGATELYAGPIGAGCQVEFDAYWWMTRGGDLRRERETLADEGTRSDG